MNRFFLLCLLLPVLLMSCGRRIPVLLLQDAPTKELFRIQGLTNRALERELARLGYELSVETVPLPSEDSSWTIESLTNLNTMDLIIISPFLESHIEELLATMSEEGRILYLGAKHSSLPGGGKNMGRGSCPGSPGCGLSLISRR